MLLHRHWWDHPTGLKPLSCFLEGLQGDLSFTLLAFAITPLQSFASIACSSCSKQRLLYGMLCRVLFSCLLALASLTLAADTLRQEAEPSTVQNADQPINPSAGSRGVPSAVTDTDPSAEAARLEGGGTTQKASESVFGAGCRWDPTSSNIEEVTFQFRTGQAPPSTWFSDVQTPATASDPVTTQTDPPSPPPTPPKLLRRTNHQQRLQARENPKDAKESPVLDASYHTRLIDVLTFRARYGSFGSSLNSAGCALPAFSERLAKLEEQEREIVNTYTRMHKPIAGSDNKPSAMFFWAGISNYDPSVRADLIQTVVFYGDGCAANPRQGLCIYSAEYSSFRYSPEDHMCMGSNMPVFYPVDTPMTVVYRTQTGFRTQEAWIDDKMVSYLRSAGDQVMNSFVITQECKGCTWPISEQVYENIVIKFSEPEPQFDALGLCTGGAVLKSPPRKEKGGLVWVIDEVRVPSGKHVKDDARADGTPGAERGPGRAEAGTGTRSSATPAGAGEATADVAKGASKDTKDAPAGVAARTSGAPDKLETTHEGKTGTAVEVPKPAADTQVDPTTSGKSNVGQVDKPTVDPSGGSDKAGTTADPVKGASDSKAGSAKAAIQAGNSKNEPAALGAGVGGAAPLPHEDAHEAKPIAQADPATPPPPTTADAEGKPVSPQLAPPPSGP